MLNSALRLRLDNPQSKANRETNTDVNRLVVRPTTRVVANPFTAEVPIGEPVQNERFLEFLNCGINVRERRDENVLVRASPCATPILRTAQEKLGGGR
jgi:hypothetical protein